jgi:sec-independent protein translocase protein TatA
MVFGFLNNPWELMIVGLIALLFFGNRLPSVMRSLGQGVTEFKKGMDGSGSDDDDDDRSYRKNRSVDRDEDRPAVKDESAAAAEAPAVKAPAAEKTADRPQ